MKILIAPLNWGLGHATRCIPLIRQYIEQGDEVVLAGDGESLVLLRNHFPALRFITLPSLELRYRDNEQQRGFYLRALPSLLRFAIADYYYLHQQLSIEHFDLVISDNRFGFFTRQTRCVYITHQLYVRLPHRLRIFQPIARAMHACFYKRFHEVWVPDYPDTTRNLAGDLCHGGSFDVHAKYIGPLSRFSPSPLEEIENGHPKNTQYSIVAILSGLEPQRTLFERQILQRFAGSSDSVLLVRGKPSTPYTIIHMGNITIVPHITDEDLQKAMQHATTIISRSGYSTIMDLASLELLHKADFYATPGQSEQEYLAYLHRH